MEAHLRTGVFGRISASLDGKPGEVVMYDPVGVDKHQSDVQGP